MKIYIKTPLLNNSQTVPHMVEHCIRKNKKPDVRRFFESHLPCEHWINWERTHIFVDYWKELESVVREIKIWLNREIYEFEKRPFKEECNNKTEWNIIFEAMLQQLISPEIRLNTWKGKTWKKVNQYHKTYYQDQNFLIFEDQVSAHQEYELKFIWSWVLPIVKVENHFFIEDFPFNKSVIFWYRNYDACHYRRLIFAWIICETYCWYFQRYELWKYFYDITVFDSFREYIWITTPKIDYSCLDKDFFEQAKNYICQILNDFFLKEKLFFGNYLYWVPAERKQIIERCRAFPWTTFQEEFLQSLLLSTNESKKK